MQAKRSRTVVSGWVALAVGMLVAVSGVADSAAGQSPVYQRRSSSFGGKHGGKHDFRKDRRQRRDFRQRKGFGQHKNFRHQTSPQVSAGTFQRPYPYHLDYYRMRYGGSYAPYFGNLYGPPNVVLAAPYYGEYGYGYGGYESGGYAPYAPGYEYPPPAAYPAGPAMDASELVSPEPPVE